MIFASALALLIYGFTAVTKDQQGLVAAVEGSLFFDYLIFGYADIVFDRYYYYETTATYHEWSDSYSYKTRLTSSSNFWGCVGTSALIGYGLSFLLNFSFVDGSKVMGIIGIICTVWSAYRIISFIFGYRKARK